MATHTVNLPDIGEGVVEGEVIEWLKKVGDPIQQDEPVVIVMTDKATVELPAPYPGKLAKQYFEVGQIAIKDKPLYDIEIKDKTIQQKTEEKNDSSIQIPLRDKQPQFKTPSSGNQILALPAVRALAKEMGLDINTIQGTGKDGRVTLDDLRSANHTHSNKLTHFEDDEEIPLVGIRNLMAQKMTESKDHIPHFSFFEQVDATRLVQLKHNYKQQAEKEGVHITFAPFIIRALSLTLAKYPQVNASLDESRNALLVHKHHHIGIAMSLSNGLVVPVLKNVQDMAINEIILGYEDLKDRAVHHKLQPNDMKESTITITNFGVLGSGGQWATPIINYPEAAILGIGRIQKQPVVKDNEIVIRDILPLSWSFDHRIIDGDLAATFSHHFAMMLQNPAQLL